MKGKPRLFAALAPVLAWDLAFAAHGERGSQLPEEEKDFPVEPKPPREVLLDALLELREGLEELELPNQERALRVLAGAMRTASIACRLGRGRPSGRLAPK